MLIDKTLVERRMGCLGVYPSLFFCALLSCVPLFLYAAMTMKEHGQQENFLMSLFNNIQTEDPSVFYKISDALILSGDVYSIAIISQNDETIHTRGTAIHTDIIELVKTAPSLWHDKNQYHTLPIHYLVDQQSLPGKLLFSIPAQRDSLWAYGLVTIIFSLNAMAFYVLNHFKKKLSRELVVPLTTIFEGIERLQAGKYGDRLPTQGHEIFGPAIDAINHLSIKWKGIYKNHQSDIDQSLRQLRESLKSAEANSIEIDSARKSALKANTAKSEFLANTSHEIRTPINGIIGFANLLRKTALTNKQGEYVDTIEESAKFLLLNINDIIDYSKLEIGKLNLDYKPVDIRLLLDESQKFILKYGDASNMSLSTEIAKKTPMQLLGDPMRIGQIYKNLLASLVELTAARAVTTQIKEEGTHDGQVLLKFSITVHNQAIETPNLHLSQKIIRSTERDNAVPTSKTQMGLMIAKGLVKRMRGDIGLISSSEHTTLWFTIMLGQPGKEENDLFTPNKAPIKILVVDDNPSNRKLVCELLGDLGVDAIAVESGQLAIDVAKKNALSLILMDIQMPGLNGLETTRIIRENEQGNHRTPIVALTAHAVDDEKSALLIAGMDDFISKPIGESELTELLSRWTSYLAAMTELEQAAPLSKPIFTSTQAKTEEIQQPVNIAQCVSLAKGKITLAREMLDMLLASLPSELDGMKSAWGKHNFETLHEIVHRVHGGACYCGVPHLRQASEQLDKSLKNQCEEAYEDQLHTLIICCESLIQWQREHNTSQLFQAAEETSLP